MSKRLSMRAVSFFVPSLHGIASADLADAVGGL